MYTARLVLRICSGSSIHAHQDAVEQAVVAEDAHPRVHADQDRGPGRHHDQQQQHGLRLLVGAAMA
jgi:hypothetical protein